MHAPVNMLHGQGALLALQLLVLSVMQWQSVQLGPYFPASQGSEQNNENTSLRLLIKPYTIRNMRIEYMLRLELLH